jgi:hypothetical protein
MTKENENATELGKFVVAWRTGTAIRLNSYHYLDLDASVNGTSVFDRQTAKVWFLGTVEKPTRVRIETTDATVNGDYAVEGYFFRAFRDDRNEIALQIEGESSDGQKISLLLHAPFPALSDIH